MNQKLSETSETEMICSSNVRTCLTTISMGVNDTIISTERSYYVFDPPSKVVTKYLKNLL